jgi:hypothetical protein
MMGTPALFRRFNEHVSAIFPSIKEIVVVTRDAQFEVRVWTTDPASERPDLAKTLEESGTGVTQVLAILAVVMNRRGNVIVIDEPNSFLHPGAAKKLIQILKRYDHQYIIATHSAEVIAAAEPSALHLVRWNGEQSVIEHLSGSNVQDLRRMLMDIGVRFSDVFGADAVVWVEGQTEEECFPKIIRHKRGRIPVGVTFKAVRATDDLSDRPDKRFVWEVYRKLSDGHALLPAALAFSFDREERDQRERDDLNRASKGNVCFLKRRSYENYLLDPEAIAAVINAECEELGAAGVTVQDVDAW